MLNGLLFISIFDYHHEYESQHLDLLINIKKLKILKIINKKGFFRLFPQFRVCQIGLAYEI